jgi:hypothetical protein
MIRGTIVFVHGFLLGGVTFREDESLVLSWWCLVYCYKE